MSNSRRAANEDDTPLTVETHPLTSYQRDIWAAAVLFPDDPQFNCVLHERLEGAVDRVALAQCVERVLRDHDTFRLRFDERDGVPFQWHSPDAPRVRELDLSTAPDAPAACAEWRASELNRALPLRRGAPVEATLLIESPTVTHLYVKAHHIVIDGWTLNQLSLLIFEHYARTVAGAPTPPGAPTSSYVSLLEQESAYRASERFEHDRNFYREALAGVEPALFGRRAPSGERRAAHHTLHLDGSLVERMLATGHTPFTYLAAVLGGYLARVHRVDEVVLGVPFLNRRHWDNAPFGQLANTQPLRLRGLDRQSLDEIAGAARAGIREAQRHERVPLGDVLRDLPAAGPRGRELFDVTVSYLRYDRPLELDGVSRRTTMRAPGRDQTVLNVYIFDFSDVPGLDIYLVYALDVFDDDFPISAFVDHLRHLIEGSLDAPDKPLATVPLTSADERAALIARGRGPVVPVAAGTVHGLLEAQRAHRPDQAAVTDAATGRTLTYAELDRRANRLARALRDQGVRPEDRVAVMMRRGLDLVVALFAVLKAGAAYVPVDPGYPDERRRFMVNDSRAALLLLDDEPRLPEAADARARSVADLVTTQPCDDPLEPLTAPGDLAYVIYTSGSTGRPKGVMVEHRSVLNRLAWMQRLHPITEDDVLLQKTPASFDVSVWEFFWWAARGARLVLLPPGGEKDPREVCRVVDDHRVSVLHFVPSMLGPFLDAVGDGTHPAERARSLRQVFCSGEALTPAHVEQFNRVFAATETRPPRLVNLYGPTEATVDVTSYRCPADAARVSRVPIGRPVDNTTLYVLDPHGQPQPTGLPGELHIGGVQVARGYLGRQELTDSRFVPDPFTAGGRLYRTGDLARWLADGDLEYLGRLDGQVKVRGNRVETGEVAAAMRALPGVSDAVVVGRAAASGGTRLIGYYVADHELEAAGLREALRRSLPDFMVPSLLARIDRVPLTPSGKTDLRALPTPAGLTDTRRLAPRTATERALAEIWAEVLGVERVGANDDYYALGGDSILMLTLRARAERRGLYFDLADLVRYPTVAGLARKVTQTPRGDTDASLEPFALVSHLDRARLEGAQDAYPLTRLQLGLIYHSRTDRRSRMYKDVFRYVLDVRWDEAAFRDAVARLVARHPALRSCFDMGHYSEPLQVVRPTVDGHLDIVDLRWLADADAETEILRHVQERRGYDYDFERGPLYQLRAHVRPTTVDLVLSFHHALLDGGSVANLLRELLQDYCHALGLDVPAVADDELPSPALHVRAERQALASSDDQRFWRRTLAGAGPTVVDGMRPYAASGGDEQIVRHVELPKDLVARVREVAREQTLSVKSVLFAAHCLTLGMFTGASEVVTGLITHGRPEEAAGERAVGLFLNTVPVRVTTTAERWSAVMREAFQRERELYAHRRYPLSAIQKDHGGTVIETAFNYVHFHQLTEVLTLPGLRLLDFQTWEETNFGLLVNVVVGPVDDRIGLRIDCDGTVISADQADLLGRTFVAVLRRMTERPHDEPDFAFLAPAPLVTSVTHGGTGGVVQRFVSQVVRAPDSVAVVMGTQQWTYQRLAQASRAVARRLLAAGTTAGTRVGVATDRSPETIAVVLGTLMAGAAVVPLDLSYPKARLAAMIERSRPLRVVAAERHAHLVPDPELLLPAETITEDTSGPAELAEPALDSTAYVLFTSGSTGEPKGVAMPHRSLANLVAWQNRVPSGAVGERTLQFAPLSFDVSFQEIFSTLCGGGTLVLVGEEQRRDMPSLLRLIDSAAVSRVFLPYVALQQMAEAADALGIAPRRLRVLISSGEQLRVTEQLRRFLAALPGAILENQYGPTESHVVTRHTLTGDPMTFPSLPPIGRPIDGSEAHVLDARLRPVPVGVRGEIYLGGVCLAQGYEGRPDLTAERFVRHPFGDAEAVLYRTGDLGVILPDGTIACTGRADSQVKVRGYRVEPAEVEAAVIGFAESWPDIRQVAVVPRRRAGGDTSLAAFLVGDPDAATLDELKKHLRSVLPAYMVPSHYGWLPSLPLTPSGKRDDAALGRVPLSTETTSSGDTVVPGSYEATLVEILAELLELPTSRVGVGDDLFDLGGTSLTAMRLTVIIEQRYGVNIPLSDFIAAPTVSGLAERLRSDNAKPIFDPLVPIRSEGTRRPIFMVHPMGGNVLCYVPLARQLPADQPLYALQAAGVDPGTEPRRSVPELASDYIAAMRRVQPSGPYAVGGWSFGGFVAFEIARQLERAGERVAPLFLLDTIALRPGHRYRHDENSLLGWFFWELLLLKRGGESPMEIIPPELTTLDEKFEFMAEFAIRIGVLPEGSSGAVVRRLFRVYETNWKATLDYRPRNATQDVTLVRAVEKLPEVLVSMHTASGSQYDDPTNGWQHMTRGQLRVVEIPGNHLSIVEHPHVENTARTIVRLLDESLDASLPQLAE